MARDDDAVERLIMSPAAGLVLCAITPVIAVPAFGVPEKELEALRRVMGQRIMRPENQSFELRMARRGEHDGRADDVALGLESLQ